MNGENMIILGIDPGLNGGLSVLEGGNLLFCGPTPNFKLKGKTHYNLGAMVQLIRAAAESGECHAFIELVHAMPKQGVTGVFRFGEGYGIWQGMLAYAGIPVTKVLPTEWKKVMLKGMDKSQKDSSILRAMQLQPNFRFLATDRSKVPHDGMAESYLIAEYGRIQNAQRSETYFKEDPHLHHRTLIDRNLDGPVV